MKIMSVRLDEDLHAQLQARANQMGIPPSVLARAYIKSALDSNVDVMATAADLGGPQINPSKDRPFGGPQINPSKDRPLGGPKMPRKSRKKRRK